MIRVNYLAAVLLFALAPLVHSNDTLTLEQAVSEALRTNFGIRIARNQAQAAEQTRVLATANMLPKVDATGAYNWTNTDADITPDSPINPDGETVNGTWNAKLALSWTLFDGFRMFKGYEQVHKLADIGSLQARAQTEIAVAQVIQAYWNLALQQTSYEIVASQVATTAERLQRQQERQQFGTLCSRELLRFQVELQSDSSRLREQELSLLTARHALNVAIGRQSQSDLWVRVVDSLPADTATLDSWMQWAKSSNAELAQAQLRMRSLELTKDIQAANFWPQLSANGSYGFTDSDTDLPIGASSRNENTQWQAGLLLRWNLFNGFLDRVSVQNAELDKQNASLELQRRQYLLESQVREQFQRLSLAIEKAQFDARALELARANYLFAEEQSKIGTLSALERRDAQQLFLQAELRWAQAKVQARLALVELQRLGGKLRLD